MPGIETMLAEQAASQGLQMGMGILGGAWMDKRQVKQEGRLRKQQMEYDKQWAKYQQDMAMQMWEKTGYGAQKEQMKKAGINPALMYGMGGGGGQTIGGPAAQSGGAHAPAGGGEMTSAMGMGIQAIAQAKLLQAQKENIEANTENIKADTANKPKQGANIDADTVNKTIQKILLEYGGKEAERQWNINKELSLQEYGAKADEYEAKSAIAAQIVKLHEEGTMQKMTEAELTNKLKDIGLKDAQITGKNLENAILKLEKEMQETFGLDKGSPGLLKMIARLVLGYIK